MLSFVMQSSQVITYKPLMLGVAMLRVAMLSVAMLRVVAPEEHPPHHPKVEGSSLADYPSIQWPVL
jgi:hypothetical protein